VELWGAVMANAAKYNESGRAALPRS
jgi:hypothetical protein